MRDSIDAFDRECVRAALNSPRIDTSRRIAHDRRARYMSTGTESAKKPTRTNEDDETGSLSGESGRRSPLASVADDLEFFQPKARDVGGVDERRRGFCAGGIGALARGWSLVFCCQEPKRGSHGTC